MKEKVAILGVGITKFGRRDDASFRELAVEAIKDAIEDAGISNKEIEALVVGNFSSDGFVKQGHLGPLIADYTGLLPAAALKTESACGSGGAALLTGVMMIASGLYKIVLVCGVEKMTHLATGEVTDILAMASDKVWEGFHGITFPGEYALIASRHMYNYGTTEEQLAMVSVKNHHNAMKNPIAHFHREFTVEQVLNSRMIAYPLKLLDCCPISDGAAAVILTSGDIAKKIADAPVWITGVGVATDNFALHDRADCTTLKATVEASRQAYNMAGIKPANVDFAEVHDCFTIAEIIAYEDLGFCGKGEGGRLVEEGQTEIGGKIPVNASGGLKAKGHPVGATGVAQAVEATMQLRGEAGERQIQGAEIGLLHNVGGNGASCFVHVLRR